MVDNNKVVNIKFELDSGETFSLGTKHKEIATTIVEFSEETLGLNCEKPEEFNEEIDEELTNEIVREIDKKDIPLPGWFEITDVRIISFKTN